MAKYTISYVYIRKNSSGNESRTASNYTVEAGSEATAIRMVEDRHSGCKIEIRSIREKK